MDERDIIQGCADARLEACLASQEGGCEVCGDEDCDGDCEHGRDCGCADCIEAEREWAAEARAEDEGWL